MTKELISKNKQKEPESKMVFIGVLLTSASILSIMDSMKTEGLPLLIILCIAYLMVAPYPRNRLRGILSLGIGIVFSGLVSKAYFILGSEPNITQALSVAYFILMCALITGYLYNGELLKKWFK
jgi:hypothetical protein